MRALPAGARAAWSQLLQRAASAPADDAAAVPVPGLASGVIMGEREIMDAVLRAIGGGRVSIGPKQDDPHAIGPKQDDPHGPRPGGDGRVSIGPKQDDPHAPAPHPDALGHALHALMSTLSTAERGVMAWLLARAGRAASTAGRPGTPGGLPARELSLDDALLVEPRTGGGPPGPVRARVTLRG